jgi:hypothetical protein
VTFDPAKWFLSPRDLFGALAPGAIGVFIWSQLAAPWGLPVVAWPPAGAADWAVFIAAAFVVGKLAEPPGHLLNAVYNRTYRAWRRRNGDPRLARVAEIAAGHVGPHDSLYGWAESHVAQAAPASFERVDRMQGVSKGFRTLALIALTGAALAAATLQWPVAAASLAVFLLAFLVFCERRYAATEEVYQAFLMLVDAGKLAVGPLARAG